MSTLIEPVLPEPTQDPNPAAWRVLQQQASAGPHAIPSALESAAVSVHLSQDDRPHDCTLLEVMMAVSEVTDDDEVYYGSGATPDAPAICSADDVWAKIPEYKKIVDDDLDRLESLCRRYLGAAG